MLTAARLREFFHYSPETGFFSRIKFMPGGESRGELGRPIKTIDPTHRYAVVRFENRTYYAHRLAWLYMTGRWPTHQIDHVNMNRSDNRFANLRPASNGQNMQNTGKSRRNTSGFKGVSWARRRGCWIGQIMANGQYYYLGSFGQCAPAAHFAHMVAADKLHREFARHG